MIGFGLSLQGACVVADEYGATHLPNYREGHVRGYFPASGCTYTSMEGPSLMLAAHTKKETTEADWDMAATSGSISCCILKRGARSSAFTLGTLSFYNGQEGISNYAYYSTCHLQLTSRLWTTEGGNITTLHYAAAATPFSTTAKAQDNVQTPVSDDGTGYLRLTIRNMVLKAHVFGTETEAGLPAFRYSAKYTRQQTLVLFGAGNVELQFFHSCWRHDTTRQAWLCLPMQSADRMAALFESTTKQMIEDETLSVA